MQAAAAEEFENDFNPHPGLIDSCFQVMSLSYSGGGVSGLKPGDDLYVPISVERVTIYAPISGRLWWHAERQGDGHSPDVSVPCALRMGANGHAFNAVQTWGRRGLNYASL